MGPSSWRLQACRPYRLEKVLARRRALDLDLPAAAIDDGERRAAATVPDCLLLVGIDPALVLCRGHAGRKLRGIRTALPGEPAVGRRADMTLGKYGVCKFPEGVIAALLGDAFRRICRGTSLRMHSQRKVPVHPGRAFARGDDAVQRAMHGRAVGALEIGILDQKDGSVGRPQDMVAGRRRAQSRCHALRAGGLRVEPQGKDSERCARNQRGGRGEVPRFR